MFFYLTNQWSQFLKVMGRLSVETGCFQLAHVMAIFQEPENSMSSRPGYFVASLPERSLRIEFRSTLDRVDTILRSLCQKIHDPIQNFLLRQV